MNVSIKRSNKAGIKPNVNQFPDSNTVIWNQADGKLWGLRIDGGGNKTVVLIGGGVNTIGEVHSRLHQIDSADDHAPVAEANRGKYVFTDPITGLLTFVDIPVQGVIVVLLMGYSSYIEPSQHNLGNKIQVDFFTFQDSKYVPISIYHEVFEDGRIFWKSNTYLNNGRAIIK